jgi:TolB-like protein/class 3 adenylate cyclase/Tfp pilus assembly protein PilF
LSDDPVERRLTAILAADVAGYSRLVGLDEEGTIARLEALRRELIDPAIARHRGNIRNTAGDSMLIEFVSVVDAVRCAVETQQTMAVRTSGEPEEKRIAFRIGINLGDVVVQPNGDLMGDGVNIAARLEGIAPAGGIVLSEDAWRQVRGRVDAKVADLGPQNLKNIARPVKAYRIELGVAGPPVARKSRLRRALIAAAVIFLIVAASGGAWYRYAKPAPADAPGLSIVVLPFANLGGDPSQDYLADILTEELTTGIARIPGSFVIARNTAATFKGKAVDVREIGRELGVRYALEGSAQPSGEKVRVNAQLIDAETGAHLWADQFDADRSDMLAMQDEIVIRLSRALEMQLTTADATRLERAHPGNPEAEDLAMRCHAALLTIAAARNEILNYVPLCKQALTLDPNNVRALASMSVILAVRVFQAVCTDCAGNSRRADDLAARALALDPNFYLAHHAKGWALYLRGELEQAEAEEERAIALNPSYIGAVNFLCFLYIRTGQVEKAISCDERGIRLSPRDPLVYTFYADRGTESFMLGRIDEAISWTRRAVADNPDIVGTYLALSAMLALDDKVAEAKDVLQHYISMPHVSIRTIAQLKTQTAGASPRYLEFRERLYEGLRKAGFPEG